MSKLVGYGQDDTKTNWVLLGAGAIAVTGMLVWWFSKPAMKANKKSRRRKPAGTSYGVPYYSFRPSKRSMARLERAGLGPPPPKRRRRKKRSR